eukprot:CAMPEP_0176353610 /NCGR_PEP_ID=MMETSP0126-20121128/11918_1 /TAXON_ID=141414 ORGANISM="Strombidinopsis acuminatum, Strain SPMC142" /NCGR_SAMPLE_ID=MMETSP0126 /ASSEMBLY_ACC=CAM_ASM_000229 /LENGTH=78 /DNA_ID=CAMNT_0017705335 /DNA_START=909 /DNA_END=1145 /DNA_ORIENTATION=+
MALASLGIILALNIHHNFGLQSWSYYSAWITGAIAVGLIQFTDKCGKDEIIKSDVEQASKETDLVKAYAEINNLNTNI